MAYRFRVVAIIESPTLGDMLGALQTSGCVVQQCDVVAEGVVTGQVPAPPHKQTLDVAVAAALPKPRASATPAQRKKRVTGLADNIRAIFDAMPDRHEFKRSEIIKPLLEAGFKLDSISPGLNHALRSTRFQRLSAGHYRVVASKVPVNTSRRAAESVRPPSSQGWGGPARNRSGMSARVWLEKYVAGMPSGSEVSRKQLMEAGKKAGHAGTSMNTTIASAYTAGRTLIRHPHKTGVYTVPSRPVRAPDAPSGTTPETIRHIEVEV